jgi:hypothetical protein
MWGQWRSLCVPLSRSPATANPSKCWNEVAEQVNSEIPPGSHENRRIANRKSSRRSVRSSDPVVNCNGI